MLAYYHIENYLSLWYIDQTLFDRVFHQNRGKKYQPFIFVPPASNCNLPVFKKKKIDLQYNTINIKLVSIHTELWAILYEIQLWYCHNHGHTNVLQVPDYYEIIKHPLDFQIVKDRLQCLVYGSVEECLEDVKLVFNNCETYNSVSMCT